MKRFVSALLTALFLTILFTANQAVAQDEWDDLIQTKVYNLNLDQTTITARWADDVVSKSGACTRVDIEMSLTYAGQDWEVNEVGTISVTLTCGDSSHVTYELVSIPMYQSFTGTVAGGSQRTFTVTPTNTGQHQFDVTARDNVSFTGNNARRLNRLVQTVVAGNSGGGNTPPVASNRSVTAAEDSSVNFTLPATDGEGDVLTYVLDTHPTHGSVSVSGASATYTPEANFNGSDSFTWHPNDGTVNGNVATVSITITPVDDPIICSYPSGLNLVVGETITVTVTCSSVDGPVTFVFGGNVPDGTMLTDNNDGTFLWSGTPTTVSDGTFTVVADDTHGSMTDTVPWTVTSGSTGTTCPVFTGMDPGEGETTYQTLKWDRVVGSAKYHVQVFNTSNVAVADTVITDPYETSWSLEYSGLSYGWYRWRLQSFDGLHWCNSDFKRFGYNLTGTDIEGGEVPEEFVLYGNYPNPFNPSTTISFELSSSTQVTLEVFDLQGRRMESLVSGVLNAGRHNVSFDASGFSSGTYMYRLWAGGGKVVTKSMVLSK